MSHDFFASVTCSLMLFTVRVKESAASFVSALHRRVVSNAQAVAEAMSFKK